MDAGEVEIRRLLEVISSFLMTKLSLWIKKQGHLLQTTGDSGLDFRLEESSDYLILKRKGIENSMKWDYIAMLRLCAIWFDEI